MRDLRDHRFGIMNADLVIAQTEDQVRWVQHFGQEVALIRNPIDTRGFEVYEDQSVQIVGQSAAHHRSRPFRPESGDRCFRSRTAH